jgi:hypothetical protein
VAGADERVMLAALSLEGREEERTLTPLQADVTADILLDGVKPSGLGKGIRGAVNVTVPALTLMGLSEEPGFLEGYGPIGPGTARQIAAGGRRASPASWCTRKPGRCSRSAAIDTRSRKT